MNLRDLAIVAAVVLLAGFAAADALRSDPSSPASPETEPRDATTDREAETDADAPVESERRRRIFGAVRAAGSLVVAEGPDCELREISVSTGVELPLPPVPTSCELWAPPSGERVAFGLSVSREDVSAFRFLDLTHPDRNLGAFEAVPGSLVWSPDGRRAAWCGADGTAYEYELGRAVAELERCPDGYTHRARLAFVEDSRIVVDGRPVLEASQRIDSFHWGLDGSVGVILANGTFERHDDGRVTARGRLPESEPAPVLAPDNCAALVIHGGRVELVDLGCLDGETSFTNRAPRTFVGGAATWSPDGTWIAVAEPRAIAFHHVVGGYDAVRWDVRAAAVAWLD